MKYWIVVLSFFACLFPIQAIAGEYILGPGDVLGINVFGIQEASVTDVTIRPDGKIVLAPIGEVEVSGLSSPDVTERITEKLRKYYTDPIVTVHIVKYRTYRVCIVGQVNRPGAYDLDRAHRLIDAIASAQGWNQEALKTKVYVIRDGGKKEPMKINLLDLLKKGDTSLNITLNEGDIVFLTENHKIDFGRDVAPLINSTYLLRNWINQPNLP